MNAHSPPLPLRGSPPLNRFVADKILRIKKLADINGGGERTYTSEGYATGAQNLNDEQVEDLLRRDQFARAEE
jgi:hypothetical protein